MCFLLQLEDGKDFLIIRNGGSDDSEIAANLTGTKDETKIAISGNQMFVVFHTNHTNAEIVRKGFHALIVESKYFNFVIFLEIEYFLSMH